MFKNDLNARFISGNKGCKFVHLNCRSLYPKISEISDTFLNFDFLSLSETWLSDQYSEGLLNISSMKMFRQDRSWVNDNGLIKKGGGVAIYVNNVWSPYTENVTDATYSNRHIEVITISVKRPNRRHMSIVTVYRPPLGNLDEFADKLEDIFDKIKVDNPEIWIMGDFNINMMDRNNKYVKRLNRFSVDHNLKQLILSSTRLNYRGGTCIDLIFTNSVFVRDSGVLNDMISDHLPVYACRKQNRNSLKSETVTGRTYKNYNPQMFQVLIEQIDWDTLLYNCNTDVMWDCIVNGVCEILSIMCPLKTFKIPICKPDWLTEEIIACINNRNKCVAIFKSTGCQDYLILSKFLRTKITKLIFNEKRRSILTKLNLHRKNPKKFWREINTLVKGDKSINTNHRIMNIDTGELIEVGKEASYINEFYVRVGESVHNSTVNTEFYPLIQIVKPDATLDFDPFTIDEVIKLSSEIEIEKSSGIPDFNSKIFKDTIKTIPSIFCRMYNKSVVEGIFPVSWSKGTVIPIPKAGSLQQASNWRPISILPIQGKILEHLIQKRIMTFLLENNIISSNQYGFMPGRSTAQAIFEVSKYSFDNINKGNICGLVFIDVSKAFDSVYHPRLLLKLEHLGLCNLYIEWFKSYLLRYQCVLFNKTHSSDLKIYAGVPQGSVLGPTLFILYINDLFNIVNGVHMTMYADDCVVYYANNRVQSVINLLERNLEYISNWCVSNRLRMNSSKTKVLYTSTKYRLDRLPKSPLLCGGKVIEHVYSYVYLGIILDAEMSLSSFATHLYNRIQVKLFTLIKIRKFIDKNTANTIYKQTILPIFDYGGFLLDSCTQKLRDDLQKLQNKALRIVYGYRLENSPNVKDLHNRSGILSLEQRREKQLLHMMLWYSKFGNHLVKGNKRTRLQCKINFKVLPLKTRKYINSPMNRGNVLWNRLTLEEQSTFSNPLFKLILDKKYKSYRA